MNKQQIILGLKGLHFDCQSLEGKKALTDAIQLVLQLSNPIKSSVIVSPPPSFPHSQKFPQVNSKLSNSDCQLIMGLSHEGWSLLALATRFKVSCVTISKVRSGCYNPKDGGTY